jgi:TNF receptor-associated factor 4
MLIEFVLFQAHLNTCKHDATQCTSNCGAMIPRVLMEDHLKYTCPQRRARCEFCGQDFTGLTLEVRFPLIIAIF